MYEAYMDFPEGWDLDGNLFCGEVWIFFGITLESINDNRHAIMYNLLLSSLFLLVCSVNIFLYSKEFGRRGGLMASALVSGSSGLGVSSGQGH